MEKYYSINKNGSSIRCKLYCVDPADISAVVVFGHGFSGHKDNRSAEKLAAKMQKRHRQTALIVFNWPCHGDDASAKLTLDGCLRYLDTVIADTKERFGTECLYGCATSFGAYLFLNYIHVYGNPFQSLALRCPAVPMYDVLTQAIIREDDLDRILRGKPVLVGFDRQVKVTKDFLAELQAADLFRMDFRPFAENTVIIHGTKDEIVPFAAAEAFAKQNGIPFFPVEAADHRFSDPKKMDEAMEIMLEAFAL